MKKHFFCSLVLAFALMVPGVSDAQNDASLPDSTELLKNPPENPSFADKGTQTLEGGHSYRPGQRDGKAWLGAGDGCEGHVCRTDAATSFGELSHVK